MKKFISILFLLFIIPTTTYAAGFTNFSEVLSSVKKDISENTGFRTSRNDSADLKKGNVLCKKGFRWDYREHRCEEVVVPEHGILNEDEISVRCEVGYRLEQKKQDTARKSTGLSPAGLTGYECIKVIVPAHAQLSGTGDDFQCDRDYVRVGDSCEKLILPPNSHIAAGGNDFDCNTGFRKVDSGQGTVNSGSCVSVNLPQNAKFFPQSDDWYCESGYQRVDDRCESVKVPANGRISETGSFFYCLPGHRLAANGKECEQVSVPQNAEPNWIGSWDCNQGYKKVDDRCEKVELPANAKFLSRGADFYCEDGYRKDENERKCIKIELPQNASWDDSSYSGWRCNQGYARRGDSCEVFNLPEHAFWLGFNSWECDAGYKKIVDSGHLTAGRCEKVSIPDNAHPSQSWEKWDCNPGYTKNYRELRCESK